MTGAVLQVQASLQQAADAQIARVVAMVDAMPQRGDADALIAPLRPRLAQIRPARPLSFTRLLFTPLDPVIVSTAEWQRCGVGIPRPALAPLADAIRAALPDDGFWQGHREGCGETGAALWPAAASVLDTLSMPADWPARSGLAMRHFAMIAACVAAVLHEATFIELLAGRRRPPEEEIVRALLARSKGRGIMALDTMVAVLLARLPSPARSLAIAADVAGADRATEQTLDRLMANLATQSEGANDPREVAVELSRLTSLMADLEAGALPERRRRLDVMRREADGYCRRSFGRAVQHTLSMAQAAATAAAGNDDAVAALEASARNLRRLEAVGRKLGSNEHYDSALAAATAVIRDQSGQLSLVDRVRVVEILAGPDAALALLSAS